MARLKALTLASAAVLGLASSAFAADLLPPPPNLEPLPPPPAADFSGWYLRGDVGLTANARNIDLTNSPDPLVGTNPGGLPYSAAATQAFNNTTLSEGGLFDVGVGYQFNHWLRGDVTVEYRGGSSFQSLYTINDPVQPNTTEYSDFYRANTASLIGMANLYADVGTWYGITPFVGGGIGMAHNTVSGFTDQGFGYYGQQSLGSAGGYFSNGTSNQFAWALMAGLDFNITSNLKLELGYRYLDYGKITTGGSNCLSNGVGGTFSNANNCNQGVANYVSSSNRLASNDFKVGLIWMLNDAPPPVPMEAPLVRKY